MTNEELATLVQSGDTGVLPILWDQVRRFIAWKARQYHGQLTPSEKSRIELDELIDAGYFAVLEACERFNPYRGGFLTILGGYTLKKAFSEVLGYYLPRQRHDALVQAISLDAPVGDEEDSSLHDLIGGIDDNIEQCIESVYTQELHGALDEVLDSLPEKERQAIVMRYYFGIKYSDQARAKGVSKQQIAENANAGLWKIRTNQRAMDQLSTFLNPDELDCCHYADYAIQPDSIIRTDDLDSYLV